MITFSIVCLVAIIIILTHLLNWMWRNIDKYDPVIIIGCVATIIYVILVWICIKHIIIWGQALHIQ